MTELDIARLYRARFAGRSVERNTLWKVLCTDFFQHLVPSTATVLDVGAGQCEFINNIRAARKLAVDLSDETPARAAADVEVVRTSCTDLSPIADSTADVVFVSNVLEHLERGESVTMLGEALRVLRPGGTLIILQPNIRYCARDYWMFWDHITPIDDRAVVELLVALGYHAVRSVPRFLPYTTVSSLPTAPWLVRLYLRLPYAWRFFGAQALITATRPAAL